MEYFTGVYLTDEELQSGKRYQVKELERMVWTSKGGTPSSIAHDVHRTVGWTKVNGIYLSHEKCYVLGRTGFPETDQEMQRIRFATEMVYWRKNDDALQHYGSEFNQLLSDRWLGKKVKQIGYSNMLTAGYEGIIADLFPKLVGKIDDSDGLVLVKDILRDFDYMTQGVFCEKHGKLALMLHPYMRLSQSIFNEFDYRFVRLLWNAYKGGNDTVKVKIDLDRVGFAPSLLFSRNDDYWYVPNYDDSTDFVGKGLQTYQMPDSYALFNQLDRTEYKWENKENGIKQIEIEEVITEKAPTFSKETYACRYLHAMIDTKTGMFDHFDGAIRAYDAEKFYNRIGVQMDKAGHDTEYTKLFRMDRNIPVSQWKGLITQYMHGNPSVYEFLGVDTTKNETKRIESPVNPLQTYVPYLIDRGDGVRIYVSYHERRECDLERKYDTCEILNTKDGPVRCMEFQAIEVAKAIWKEGGKLDLEEGIKYVIVEDYIHNIPVIMHGDENQEQNMKVTLDGIKNLIRMHVKKGDDDVYSFCLSWNMDDANVCLSFMGHVEDLYDWLKRSNVIPTGHKNFIVWLDRQSKLLKKRGKDSLSPSGSNLIKSDGVLYLQRRPVLKDASSLGDYEKREDGVYGKLTIDDKKKDLGELLNKGKIFTTPELLVTGAKCVDTGDDYLKTVKSGIFGETTYMPDCEMLGFMWAAKARPICLG